MLSKGIDIEQTLAILDSLNAGLHDHATSVTVVGVPKVDGRSIVASGADANYTMNEEDAHARLSLHGVPMPAGAELRGGSVAFTRAALVDLGERLYDRTAWGVLNGGSATSYADRKKNSALGSAVFAAILPGFELLAPLCEGQPKGLTPAYINPDGSPGASFLVLKMRAALLKAARYARRFGSSLRPVLPFFQMTSAGTDEALARAYTEYATHPWLAPLIAAAGTDPTKPRSARQALLAAFTHSADGKPYRIFDHAYGKVDSAIALPGGHGQSFKVLSGVYKRLLADGYRYAWLGNVDNIAYSPEPAELAIAMLSGAEAAFEFSYRTPVDVKGGILVVTADGRKTVADIGQAISFESVLDLERRGERVLFNCATCVLDLEQIVPRLDYIRDNLPVRISDQDKDSGRYSQAEQSTWESVGLLDKPLGFAVQKGERFIAAKLLAETVLASGAVRDGSELPPDIAATAAMMSGGLESVLSDVCGLKLEAGRWVPAELV
ncbi:MAG: UTP--glucose-1-phosphate uridylyltransferase [Spirochaetales bacterium]|nr:UTP--glucose-1-phosphate uridylyltransferase [Spirochaetales bacterium]